MTGLLYGEETVTIMLSRFHGIYRNMTDILTDKQTDRIPMSTAARLA